MCFCRNQDNGGDAEAIKETRKWSFVFPVNADEKRGEPDEDQQQNSRKVWPLRKYSQSEVYPERINHGKRKTESAAQKDQRKSRKRCQDPITAMTERTPLFSRHRYLVGRPMLATEVTCRCHNRN